ncbi:predicted protein [Histoplasma capsulatum var. duboisii H88]|nr:predicted protein [Histoplasma capsulatum var. duboisii H88]
MCQVRAHFHQPCGCKSHQLRVCNSYKTRTHVPTNANAGNSSAATITTTTTTTERCSNSSSYISLHTIPRFLTICSKAFNPDIFSACPSFNMHPEVIDPHPCSDHWTMLSDVRLFFGPPRGLGSGNDNEGEGEEAVMAEDEGKRGGGGGGQRWQWSLFDAGEDESCPDPLRTDHLNSLRERYCCPGGGGVVNGNYGGDDAGGGGEKGVGDHVSNQQQSQVGDVTGTSCGVTGTTEAKKRGWTFLDMFLDWMGS